MQHLSILFLSFILRKFNTPIALIVITSDDGDIGHLSAQCLEFSFRKDVVVAEVRSGSVLTADVFQTGRLWIEFPRDEDIRVLKIGAVLVNGQKFRVARR